MAQVATRRNRPYAARMTPEQRREQLLDMVLDLIDTDGIGVVSMDSVARRAGVTRPVVYALFADTNDLLRASLDREEKRALAQIASAPPAAAHGDLAASIIGIFDAYFKAVAEAPKRWRAIYVVADSGTPAFHRRVERGRSTLAGQLQEILRASQELDPDTDFELVAYQILATVWDAGRLLLTQPNEFPHDRLMASMSKLISALAIEHAKGP